MKTKRANAGCYEMTGTTTLDGQAVEVRFNIWKHEEIANTWMSETTIDGRSTGIYSDHWCKKAAVAACKRCAEHGYRTVAGLGICLN
jgi:hypothetical protein